MFETEKAICLLNNVATIIRKEKSIQAAERCVIAALNTDGGAFIRMTYDKNMYINYDDCFVAEMNTINGTWELHYGDTIISS